MAEQRESHCSSQHYGILQFLKQPHDNLNEVAKNSPTDSHKLPVSEVS